jgi:hypothetical protein
MNMLAFLGSQRKEESHEFHPCHGGEGIVEVDPLPLHETACHQASLVLDNGPVDAKVKEDGMAAMDGFQVARSCGPGGEGDFPSKLP